jgi:hypothetical protein
MNEPVMTVNDETLVATLGIGIERKEPGKPRRLWG